MKECDKRGCKITLGDEVYHQCCHVNRTMFIFCENAIKYGECPGEKK